MLLAMANTAHLHELLELKNLDQHFQLILTKFNGANFLFGAS